MLLNLVKNEFIKIFKRSKTWIVFILFLIFVCLTIFGTYKTDKDMREWSSPEYQIKMAEEQLVYARDSIKEAENSKNEEWLQSAKEQEEYWLEEIERNKKILKDGIDEDAWIKTLNEQIKNTEEQIKQIEDEGISKWNKTWYLQSKEDLENLKYLKENNIIPLEGWEYHQFNFLRNLNIMFGVGILIVGIAVFISDILSGECTPATLKFLLVQPVKRGKILLSKYIVAIITVVTLITIPQFIGMGIVNMTSDLNPKDYPIRIEQKYEKTYDSESGEMILSSIEDTSKMVSMKEFTAKSLGYEVLFLITTTTFVFMLSTLFKSSMTSMATSVIIGIFLTIATQTISSVRQYSHLLFTTYSNSNDLLTSSLAIELNNQNLTTSNAIICMFITTIICYLVAHINFSKKDILI